MVVDVPIDDRVGGETAAHLNPGYTVYNAADILLDLRPGLIFRWGHIGLGPDISMRHSIRPAALFLPLLALLAACAPNDAGNQAGAASTPPPAVAPKPDFNRIKVHALAFSAILGEMNEATQTKLMVMTDPEGEKKQLADWWGVKNRDDLLLLFTGMENGFNGHRGRIHELVTYYRSLRPEEILPKLLEKAKSRKEIDGDFIATTYIRVPDGKSLRFTAWDFGRYINLCRWGYGVGYLSEDEAWARILPAARLLQSSFGSWQEFAQDYIGGREFWSAAQMRKNGTEARAAVVFFNSPGGLWTKIPWNESLGDGPVLVDQYAEMLKSPPAQDKIPPSIPAGLEKKTD